MTNTNEKMYSYQPIAVDMLLDCLKLPILIPYGGGKSWVVLEAIKRSKAYQVIILCKKRNIPTWIREIKKRLGDPSIYSIVGSPHKRKKIMATSADIGLFIWLVPYPSLHNIIKQMKDLILTGHQLYIDWIVADESTTIKNPGATTTRAALQLSKMYPDARKAILTGNVAPETFKEVWSQFAFCDIKRFGSTYYRFLRRWFVLGEFNQWALDLGKKDQFLDLLTRMSFMLTHLEYRELMKRFPKSRYVIEHYKCTSQQKKLLKQLYKDWELPIGKSALEQYNYVITLGTKAQQICSGFYYTEGDTITLAGPNNKARLLRAVVSDLLRENEHRKIIVWRKFKEEDALIYWALYSYRHLTLLVPTAENLELFEDEGSN